MAALFPAHQISLLNTSTMCETIAITWPPLSLLQSRNSLVMWTDTELKDYDLNHRSLTKAEPTDKG